MRSPAVVVPGFLDDDGIGRLLDAVDDNGEVHHVTEGVQRLVDQALLPSGYALARSSDGRSSTFVIGDTTAGMDEHRDLVQDGTHSLLVYLTECEGGATVVGSRRITPEKGKAVIFSETTLHHAEPCTSGRKLVAVFEATRVESARRARRERKHAWRARQGRDRDE